MGLSLDARKRYHMVQCPCTWAILGIYDSLDDALLSATVRCLPEKYDKEFDRTFCGHYYEFQKGFSQNLSVWEILEEISEEVKTNVKIFTNIDHKDRVLCENARQEAMEYINIDKNMQPYQKHIYELYSLKH